MRFSKRFTFTWRSKNRAAQPEKFVLQAIDFLDVALKPEKSSSAATVALYPALRAARATTPSSPSPTSSLERPGGSPHAWVRYPRLSAIQRANVLLSESFFSALLTKAANANNKFSVSRTIADESLDPAHTKKSCSSPDVV